MSEQADMGVCVLSFSFSNSIFFCILFLTFRDSNPVLILKPAELAGMSLENRLTSYDWQSQFDVFQRVTRNGSFRPICLDAKNNMLAVSSSKKNHHHHIIIIMENTMTSFVEQWAIISNTAESDSFEVASISIYVTLALQFFIIACLRCGNLSSFLFQLKLIEFVV